MFRLGENAPDILREVCLERGWEEYPGDGSQDDGDWNLWWKPQGFTAVEFEQCRPWQRLNHFPKSTNITRKDGLARNLRRMRTSYGGPIFDFFPITFILPNEYKKFVAEFSKQEEGERSYWICKPTEQSCGRGIFIFQDLHDLTYDCAVVVQKYIVKPLLISGYKFDLRLYVIVTSFHPFRLYIYHEGLVRFSTERFDLSRLNNPFSHLTNTSINKKGPQYSVEKESIGKGCKWTLTQLRVYLDKHNIDGRLLWHRITSVIIITMLSQVQEMPSGCPNCFELFGFDILVDEKLKPWLLEVNFSPALGNDCLQDELVKKPLLNDILNFLNFSEGDIKRGKKDKETTSKNKRVIKNGVNDQSNGFGREVWSKPYGAEGHTTLPEAALKYKPVYKISKNSALSKNKEKIKREVGRNGTYKNLSKGSDDKAEEYGFDDEEKKRKTFGHLLSGSSSNHLHCGGLGASKEFLKAVNNNIPMVEATKKGTLVSKVNGLSVEKQTQSYEQDLPAGSNCKNRHVAPSIDRKTSTLTNLHFTRGHTLPLVYFSRTFKKDKPLPSNLQHYHSEGSLIKTVHLSSHLGTTVPLNMSPSQHSSRGLTRNKRSSEKDNLQTQFGNCILAFPFNEVTRRASQGNLDHKVVIEEMRKIMKASRIHIKESTKGENEDNTAFDLTKPFWGYRSKINTFYSSIS